MVSNHRKSPGAGDDPQLFAQGSGAGGDLPDRRVAGAPVDADHPDQDDHRHRDAHDPIAVATADLVADHGALAPAIMIVRASSATRQVISRVRSSYDDVISAGIAT